MRRKNHGQQLSQIQISSQINQKKAVQTILISGAIPLQITHRPQKQSTIPKPIRILMLLVIFLRNPQKIKTVSIQTQIILTNFSPQQQAISLQITKNLHLPKSNLTFSIFDPHFINLIIDIPHLKKNPHCLMQKA